MNLLLRCMDREATRAYYLEVLGFQVADGPEGSISATLEGGTLVFTEADLSLQTVDAVRPFAEHIAECFGHDRIVYGSDWPVCALAAECSKWVEFVQALTAEWSTEEKKCFYRDNAEEFYRLNS